MSTPPDIAREVGRTTGTDLSGVPVFRGPAVDAAARGRGARAFARADAVFLPDAAGPLTAPKARALVAHELVHVAQQRARGRTPEAASLEGRRMEAEAVAVERRYETTTAAGPDLHHPPAPASVPELPGPAQLAPAAPAPTTSSFEQPEREEIVQIAETSAHRVVEQWSHPALSSGTTQTPPEVEFDRASRRHELEAEMLEMINVDRLYQNLPPVGHLEQADLERLERRLDREQYTGFRPSIGGHRTRSAQASGVFGDMAQFTETVGVDGSAQPGAPSRSTPFRSHRRAAAMADGVFGDMAQFSQTVGPDGTPVETEPERTGSRRSAREADGVFGDMVQFSESTTPPSTEDDQPSHGSEREPFDLDRLDLEELTARLYNRLRGRLRLELLVDRERAGLLTDFR